MSWWLFLKFIHLNNNVIIPIKYKLTKPVLGRTKISPLVEDHIEDDHDANHGVERNQSFPRRELSFLMDNHEGEKDDHSGHKIHQHLQHQDQDVQTAQRFLFVFVT